jgi:NADPH2:quinone reductase
MPVTGLTALQGIANHLDVQTGEHIMIHGASGGVGTLAIQFAKERGAKVLAVASSPDGVALVQRLGADAAVDGHHDDFVEAAFRICPQGRGYCAYSRQWRFRPEMPRCASPGWSPCASERC